MTEYDLATGSVVRAGRLPPLGEMATHVRLLPNVDGLDVLAWSDHDLWHVFLSHALDVQVQDRLCHFVGDAPSGIAGDERRGFVVAQCGLPTLKGLYEQDGFVFWYLEAKGHESDGNIWPTSSYSLSAAKLRDDLVLVGDRAYVLATETPGYVALLALSERLVIVDSIAVPAPALDALPTALEHVGDHLQIDWPGDQEVTDVSLDLRTVARHVRSRPPPRGAPCFDHAVVGDVDVSLCRRGAGETLEWTRRGS